MEENNYSVKHFLIFFIARHFHLQNKKIVQIVWFAPSKSKNKKWCWWRLSIYTIGAHDRQVEKHFYCKTFSYAKMKNLANALICATHVTQQIVIAGINNINPKQISHFSNLKIKKSILMKFYYTKKTHARQALGKTFLYLLQELFSFQKIYGEII